jgi:vacuolar protein sorting-associated protein 72
MSEETRDVFLEDFADTDEEVEMDEEEQERLMRREERRKVGVSTKKPRWS